MDRVSTSLGGDAAASDEFGSGFGFPAEYCKVSSESTDGSVGLGSNDSEDDDVPRRRKASERPLSSLTTLGSPVGVSLPEGAFSSSALASGTDGESAAKIEKISRRMCASRKSPRMV